MLSLLLFLVNHLIAALLAVVIAYLAIIHYHVISRVKTEVDDVVSTVQKEIDDVWGKLEAEASGVMAKVEDEAQWIAAKVDLLRPSTIPGGDATTAVPTKQFDVVPHPTDPTVTIAVPQAESKPVNDQ